MNIKDNKNKIQNEANDEPDEEIDPALYPNERYNKTNVACPSDENVSKNRNWVQFSKL